MEFMVNRRTCVDENGTVHTFEYFLLQDRLCRDGFDCRDYGVRVRSGAGEDAGIHHITPDRQRMDALLTLLYEHGVSPIHLRDVVEDWL